MNYNSPYNRYQQPGEAPEVPPASIHTPLDPEEYQSLPTSHLEAEADSPEQEEAFSQATLRIPELLQSLEFSDEVLVTHDRFDAHKILRKSDLISFLEQQSQVLCQEKLEELQEFLLTNIDGGIKQRWQMEQQGAIERVFFNEKIKVEEALSLKPEDIQNQDFKGEEGKQKFREMMLQRAKEVFPSGLKEGHPFLRMLEEFSQQRIHSQYEQWQNLHEAQLKEHSLQKLNDFQMQLSQVRFSNDEVERKQDFWENPELFMKMLKE